MTFQNVLGTFQILLPIPCSCLPAHRDGGPFSDDWPTKFPISGWCESAEEIKRGVDTSGQSHLGDIGVSCRYKMSSSSPMVNRLVLPYRVLCPSIPLIYFLRPVEKDKGTDGQTGQRSLSQAHRDCPREIAIGHCGTESRNNFFPW